MAEEESNGKKRKAKRCARCSCPCLVVLAVALGLGFLQQSVAGLLRDHAAVMLGPLVALQAVRTGEPERRPWHHLPLDQGLGDPTIGGLVMQAGWKALLGINWLHPVLPRLDLSFLTLPSDTESRFCHSLLSYMWSHPLVSHFSYPSIYAGYAEVHGWIQTCKAVWHELSQEEKMLLQSFRARGAIPMEILIAPVEDNDGRKRAARTGPLPLFEASERMTREEIRELLRDSIADTLYAGREDEPSESMLDYYSAMNVRRAVEIPSSWRAVGDAIRAGRIAKFDATPLLPRELFNVSYASMAQWEGALAEKIPIFGDRNLPTSFAHFADAKASLMDDKFVRTLVTLADERLATVNGGGSGFGGISSPYMRWSPTGYVHTRRLPAFHKKLPDIEKLMGIEDDVLRGQSMLWMGSTPGGFHYDEEANVYVQLSGVTVAILVPQNWTDYFTGAVRHPWGSQGLPGWQELEKDPDMKNVPIYLVPLRPGDGVTLHGRTYHRFMAQTHDRIALNWFFIPGWRKMEYTPADWYSIEAAKSPVRLAIRQLWARTIAKLYDDTGMGVVYMGTKLEYL